jgi:hypothetical protein
MSIGHIRASTLSAKPMQTFLDCRHLAHEKELNRLPVVTLPDVPAECAAASQSAIWIPY